MRRLVLALLHELDEVDAAEAARWSRIIASALLRELPPEDRFEAMSFLIDQHRRTLLS
jgi:hypothetical protein